MSRTEQLIEEISQLPDSQVQEVYQALAKKLELQAKADQLIAKVCGVGSGIWATDAQQYINNLRQHDRV